MKRNVVGLFTTAGDDREWCLLDVTQGRTVLTVDGRVVLYAKPGEARRIGQAFARAANLTSARRRRSAARKKPRATPRTGRAT